MQLNELFRSLDNVLITENVDITSLEYDSRRVMPGSLFFAIKGERFDGHEFIPEAIKRGARAVVAEHEIDDAVPHAIVENARITMGELARTFYGTFDSLTLIGITGTNGKTTTAFLIHNILKCAEFSPGLLGTVWYIIGDTVETAGRTTPESLDIYKAIHTAQQKGTRAMVMEISSHALSLHRVDTIQFHSAVFTNLSQDHLDFHHTIEAYAQAKFHLFSLLRKNGCGIINMDDPKSSEIQRLSIPRLVSYGINNSADYTASITDDSISGLTLEIRWSNNRQRVMSPLIGSFNAYNILASFATTHALGIDIEVIGQGISTMNRVPGRMERIVNNLFVDYAHTPDAIKNALSALRRYCKRQLIIVFGCGGDRDRGKRPIMGKIASEYADQVIVTSDNPRHENPRQVIRDIEQGIRTKAYTVIEDRAEAIAHAVGMMQKGDIVLVAGKGHEKYQTIGDSHLPFDDAEVIRQCFEN